MPEDIRKLLPATAYKTRSEIKTTGGGGVEGRENTPSGSRKLAPGGRVNTPTGVKTVPGQRVNTPSGVKIVPAKKRK